MSASAVSCTQFIKGVKINHDGADLLIVDSPGLEDTRGPELDISNIYGIVKAAQACESIVPLILISEKGMGERMTGLKRISKDLANMFSNIDSDISSLQFLFNKYINRKKADQPLGEDEVLAIK